MGSEAARQRRCTTPRSLFLTEVVMVVVVMLLVCPVVRLTSARSGELLLIILPGPRAAAVQW